MLRHDMLGSARSTALSICQNMITVLTFCIRLYIDKTIIRSSDSDRCEPRFRLRKPCRASCAPHKTPALPHIPFMTLQSAFGLRVGHAIPLFTHRARILYVDACYISSSRLPGRTARLTAKDVNNSLYQNVSTRTLYIAEFIA